MMQQASSAMLIEPSTSNFYTTLFTTSLSEVLTTPPSISSHFGPLDMWLSSPSTSSINSTPVPETSNHGGLDVCPEDVYTEDQVAYRVYANMPISLFGIFANILNVVLFCDAEMRTQLVNHFLLALSVSDLFLLICNFFFLVLPVMVVETDSFFWNDIFPIIIRYSYPLALTTQTSGVYLTVLVSVHRFLGVCYPFKAKRWVTRRPVQYAIIGSVVFSVLVNVPTWLELSVVPCFSDRFNRISRKITLAPFHEMTYILVKKTLVYTFVMFVVPFTALILVNLKIVMALRESTNLRTMHTYSTKMDFNNDGAMKQFRLLKNTKYSEIFHTFSKLSNASIFRPTSEIFKPKFTNSTRDRSVTLMLLAIVALFLGCNGLAFCNSIIESIMLIRTPDPNADPELEQRLVKLFECSVEISNVLITLNSSTSTLVYVIFSSKYRMIIKSLLRLEKRPERPNRVAITTAMAAHRAMELSLIPEEVDRRRRETIFETQPFDTNLIMNINRRGKLFRSQTTLNQSMTNSESNLRLMDNEDNGVSSEEKSNGEYTTFEIVTP
ncbi:serpentine type 7TM GPCR chemoreceptor srw domain-containing protein [Ditylenchus destructor]|nr:serpentine type 7TM GPCR chemoreceptor srw domain-containing protein [Ditylenchus destructor]